MKDADFNDCLDSSNAVRITPDKEKARSLTEIAEERLKWASKDVNKHNANFIFEDYYSSIIELIHSLTLIAGYKINNHICLGFYLRNVLKREELFRLFDDLRYKRNSLTYYGKKMDFEIAKDAIEKSKRLIKELNKLVFP